MKKYSYLLVMAASLMMSACSTLNETFKEYKPTAEVPKKTKLTASWIKNLDPVYDSGNLPIGLQSPLINEGIVYAGHNSGYMQAYELENGRLIWSEFDGSTYHAGAVAYKDQVIYGTVQGRVVSRHGILGAIKYSVDLGASIETRGVISNGRIFFQLRNHQVFCLDVETGKIIWGYKRSVPYLTTLQRASTPLVFKDKLLVGFADGTFAALSIEEGVLLYETKLGTASKFVDVDNPAFIYNDRVYISPAGGALSLIDPNTGKILRTSEFSTSRAPIVRDDQLVFGTPSGELVLTDKNLNLLKTVKVSEGVVTNITPFKSYLAIGTTAGEIKLVDQKTLEVVETYKLGHAYSAVFGEMMSNSDNLGVLSSRNRLFIFN
ncbi:MAG: PQQ-binding-like beta-propeller repeat protein [Bdellovibrionales bacterium]|nr:PQQ-binding-like beta-propeller repeat protein [Bdellovibrionales bacterium]